MVEQVGVADHKIRPISEYPLPIEYRDTSSLRADGEAGVYVDRLITGVSMGNEVLNAEDILDSTAIILINNKTGLSYLAVIDNTLTGEQSSKMSELSEGEYDLVVVVGKGSRQEFDNVTNPGSSVIEAFSAHSNNILVMAKGIDIDYGARGWCVAFNPKTRIVKVYTKSDGMVKVYKV